MNIEKNIMDEVTDGEKLPAIIGQMLKERGMTIAVAESCTGGLISNLITDISGASEYFERAVVSYSNRSKCELLGVSQDTIDKFGAVSAETAITMAEGVRKSGGTKIGVAVTGIAGPNGGTPAKPVGTVFIAISQSSGAKSYHYIYRSDRVGFKKQVALKALDLVRRSLLDL